MSSSVAFSFYRSGVSRYVALTIRFKAVINRDEQTGRRHVYVFDRVAVGNPCRYLDSAASIYQAKVLANQFLTEQGRA